MDVVDHLGREDAAVPELISARGSVLVGGKVTSLGVDCVEAELTAADDEFLARKLGIYQIESPAAFRKFVCGRKLWNYDNLEPAERKLVL